MKNQPYVIIFECDLETIAEKKQGKRAYKFDQRALAKHRRKQTAKKIAAQTSDQPTKRQGYKRKGRRANDNYLQG